MNLNALNKIYLLFFFSLNVSTLNKMTIIIPDIIPLIVGIILGIVASLDRMCGMISKE